MCLFILRLTLLIAACMLSTARAYFISSSHDPESYRLHRKRFVGGAGTYPLVGTPARIAEEMVRMSEVGFAGTTVSFVNFRDELPYFIETVLPLLREAGLREA